MNGALVPAVPEGGQCKQAADRQVGLCGVAEGAIEVKEVPGAPSVPLAAEVAALFEVHDDALDRALGDAAGRGEVPQAGGGVARDGQEHAGVVGEKAPPGRLRVHATCPSPGGCTAGNTGNQFCAWGACDETSGRQAGQTRALRT